MLDPLSHVDIFCLHIVYIPRIDLSLEEFTRQHNHGLRTEHHHHRSPLQLFYRSAFHNPEFDLVQPFQASDYSVDEGGPSPEMQDDDRVVVDPVQVSLMDMQLQVLHRLIESIQEREDFGVTVPACACYGDQLAVMDRALCYDTVVHTYIHYYSST